MLGVPALTAWVVTVPSANKFRGAPNSVNKKHPVKIVAQKAARAKVRIRSLSSQANIFLLISTFNYLYIDIFGFCQYPGAMAKKTRKHPVLTGDALELVAARFRALSDPKRLRILNLLMQGEHSVQELADAAGLEQPTVSRNLSQLRREGIVARRSEGNRAIYQIRDATVIQLCDIVCGELAERFSEGLEALGDPPSR